MAIPRFALTSDAIDSRGYFDPRYTCDYDNSSPELRWENPPDGTASFVLIAEDRTPAPEDPNRIVTHWVVYHIPSHLYHLPTGIPPQDVLPNGIRQGLNHWRKLGYAGPCPPVGALPREYIFRLYALRLTPELPSRATREQVIEAIAPFVIATTEIQGKYTRVIEQAG